MSLEKSVELLTNAILALSNELKINSNLLKLNYENKSEINIVTNIKEAEEAEEAEELLQVRTKVNEGNNKRKGNKTQILGGETSKGQEETKSEEIQEENCNEEITSDVCKELAKEKIAKGIKRTDIKVMIKELGADQISELTAENLVELYDQLKAL